MATFKSKKEALTLSPPEVRNMEEHWHVTQKGFGIRVMRTSKRTGKATRSYLARYKDEKGKDIKQVLGGADELDYDDAMAQAWNACQKAKVTRRDGVAPLPKLGDALEEYIARRPDLSPVTVIDYRKYWGYLETWHSKSTAILGDQFWVERHAELLRDSGKATADGMLRVAHMLYNKFVAMRRMPHNPVAFAAAENKIYARGRPSRPVVARADLPKVWEWVRDNANPSARDVIYITMMTGLRKSVVGSLKWEQVDMERRMLYVPAEVKGNKAKSFVWIPAPDWLFENVLARRLRTRVGNSPWVVPSWKFKGKPACDYGATTKSLFSEINVAVGPHILRRTFATIARQAVSSETLVAELLTHSQGNRGKSDVTAVTAGYFVSGEDERRDAFNAVAALTLRFCTDPDYKVVRTWVCPDIPELTQA